MQAKLEIRYSMFMIIISKLVKTSSSTVGKGPRCIQITGDSLVKSLRAR